MATFNKQGITDAGRRLYAEVQSGAIFDATRLVVGAGSMGNTATVASMTAVITPVTEIEITKKVKSNDGKAIFGGVLTNKDINTEFYFREFALFARPKYVDASGKVTYGDEVLYVYGNAGSTADLIPAYSTTTALEKVLDMVVYVGNDATVNLTVSSGATVTQEALDNAINEHNEDEDAHPLIVAKIEDAIDDAIGDHNKDADAHSELFDDYLPRTGGDLTGNVNVKHNNYPKYIMTDTTTGMVAWIERDPNTGANLAVANAAGDVAVFHLGDADESVENALTLLRRISGKESTWRVYHEGFKPTPGDIGALPLDGSLPMTGTNVFFNNGLGRLFCGVGVVGIDSLKTAMMSDANGRQLLLSNADKDALVAALVLRDWASGKFIDYKLYGEHNKPNLTDLPGVLSVEKGGTGVTSLDALATAIGAARLKSGSYSGSGQDNSQPAYADSITTKGRKITLPCTPKFMYLWCIGNGGNSYQFLSQGSKLCFTIGSNKFTVAYLDGDSLYVVSTSNTTSSFGCDNSGVTYNWFALL